MPRLSLHLLQRLLIHNIISNHHKIMPYKKKDPGPSSATEARMQAGMKKKTEADVIEAVRRSDLVDFSFGFLSMGLPWAHIHEAQAHIPEAGFHLTLLGFLPRIHGWNVVRAVIQLSRIFRW